MEPQETVDFTNWLAKADPRVMYEESANEIWHHALRKIPARAAKAAVMEHIRLYSTAPKPSDIATRAKQLMSSFAAKQRAIETAKTRALETQPADETPLRQRDPELWERLLEQGRQEAEKAKKERAA